LVLKLGAAHGLTLFQIGMILYRPGFEETPSRVEMLLDETDKLYSLYEKSSIISLCPSQLENNSDGVYITENSIFIDEEETKAETSCRHRKTSLLKRTTSEPRLTYREIQSKEFVDNDINVTKDTKDEFDNPYNELYFYIFENVLSEYIHKFKK
jgi:hypothetical protein